MELCPIVGQFLAVVLVMIAVMVVGTGYQGNFPSCLRNGYRNLLSEGGPVPSRNLLGYNVVHAWPI